jgi:outer membrane murein-binding lipoprotein Lpp
VADETEKKPPAPVTRAPDPMQELTAALPAGWSGKLTIERLLLSAVIALVGGTGFGGSAKLDALTAKIEAIGTQLGDVKAQLADMRAKVEANEKLQIDQRLRAVEIELAASRRETK